MHWIISLMLSDVSEILGRFIWYFASCMATLWEQNLDNRDVMDEKSRTMHLHSSYYGSFTLLESAINAIFSLS